MVSYSVTTERYVVLDAKLHLVFDLERDFLEAPDGKARIEWSNFSSNGFRPHLERVLRFFSLDVENYTVGFTETVPPFVMYTAIVRELIEYVCAKEKDSFTNIFIRSGFTEFFLYGGYIVKTRLSVEMNSYTQSIGQCQIIWGRHVSDCKVKIDISKKQQAPFFGVHTDCNNFYEPQIMPRPFVEFWRTRGLFGSRFSAWLFIGKLYCTIQIYSLSAKVRIFQFLKGFSNRSDSARVCYHVIHRTSDVLALLLLGVQGNEAKPTRPKRLKAPPPGAASLSNNLVTPLPFQPHPWPLAVDEFNSSSRHLAFHSLASFWFSANCSGIITGGDALVAEKYELYRLLRRDPALKAFRELRRKQLVRIRRQKPRSPCLANGTVGKQPDEGAARDSRQPIPEPEADQVASSCRSSGVKLKCPAAIPAHPARAKANQIRAILWIVIRPLMVSVCAHA